MDPKFDQTYKILSLSLSLSASLYPPANDQNSRNFREKTMNSITVGLMLLYCNSILYRDKIKKRSKIQNLFFCEFQHTQKYNNMFIERDEITVKVPLFIVVVVVVVFFGVLPFIQLFNFWGVFLLVV